MGAYLRTIFGDIPVFPEGTDWLLQIHHQDIVQIACNSLEIFLDSVLILDLLLPIRNNALSDSLGSWKDWKDAI